MTIWKFLIPDEKYVPDPIEPAFSYRGCVAVCAAPDEPTARKRLRDYASENGLDARWLRVAKVIRVDVGDNPSVLAWAQL